MNNPTIRFSVDCLGGDLGPTPIVEGIKKAANHFPRCTFLLVGDKGSICNILGENLPGNIEIVHATGEPVTMTTDSFWKAGQSSMAIAINLVKTGKADYVLSPGNTAIYSLMCVRKLGKVTGATLPAIATAAPRLTKDIYGVSHIEKMIVGDTGASTKYEADDTVRLVLMLHRYAEITGVATETSRCALLTYGSESVKGGPEVVDAHKTLSHILGDRFSPENAEGNCMNQQTNKFHAVACNAVSGNILLKSMEGTLALLLDYMKQELASPNTGNPLKNAVAKIGALLAKPAMHKIKKDFTKFKVGGNQLLGVKGNVMVMHGNSDAEATYNAVCNAIELYPLDIPSQMAQALSIYPKKAALLEEVAA